ncbi:MAG: histidine kinase [Synergistaceae bacterium]|nr:histidine kinase [Synergistaceae bacterium]
MRKHMLIISMSVITLLAGSSVFTTLHVFRAQETALDSMMRSYVLDLVDNISDTLQSPGRRDVWHGRMTRFRMLSMSPLLPNGDSGGVLILTEEGRVLSASAGAEKLIPLWEAGVSLDEPRMVQDAEGKQFCVAAKDAGNGLLVLAAVSRTHLLGPILDVRRLWMSLAVLTPLTVFAGMLGLWMYLAAPLHRVVESIRHMKWGRDRPQTPERLGFYEIEALSNAIAELAGEAIAREKLKVRYVSDIVRIQEDSRKRLARDLHDSPLQGIIAAIKWIQLAQSSTDASALSENLEMAEEVAQNAAKEIRNYCEELSPSWVKLGLSAAMFENADRLSRAFGVEVEVRGAEEAETDLEISEEHVLAFVRILQEAVSNSARHGRASRVETAFSKNQKNGGLLFQVLDDGSGMAEQEETDYENLRATGHRGLAHIHERVRLLKGTMRLGKQESEKGFLIDIEVPV